MSVRRSTRYRIAAPKYCAVVFRLRERTTPAYGDAAAGSVYFLGYHQAMHVAMHCGQIRTIRNLYRKTRGAPARFFPDNPTYPA